MTQEGRPVAEHITTSEKHRQGFAMDSKRTQLVNENCKSQAGTTEPSSHEHRVICPTGRG